MVFHPVVQTDQYLEKHWESSNNPVHPQPNDSTKFSSFRNIVEVMELSSGTAPLSMNDFTPSRSCPSTDQNRILLPPLPTPDPLPSRQKTSIHKSNNGKGDKKSKEINFFFETPEIEKELEVVALVDKVSSNVMCAHDLLLSSFLVLPSVSVNY